VHFLGTALAPLGSQKQVHEAPVAPPTSQETSPNVGIQRPHH